MSIFKQTLIRGLLLVCAILATPLSAASIPILVDHYLPDDRDAAHVRFGVPFPINTLKTDAVNDVRVIDDLNKPTVIQTRVTATWDAAGNQGVRWLLVDMQAQRGRSYKLVFNEPSLPPAEALPPIATLKNGKIEINAGAITGTLATKGFDPFHQLEALGAPMAVELPEGETGLGNRDFSAFYIEHETKGIYRSDLDYDATVVLEETGPERAIIKADGWYTNSRGEKFCRFSIRLHITRDKPDLRIDHTWIYTGVSSEDRLRSVSMQIRRCDPKTGKAMRGFTGDSDMVAGAPAMDFSGNIRMIQDTTKSGHAELVAHYDDGSISKIAEQGGGWLSTLGINGTQLVLRDAWQQYPWGMDMQDGIIRVHFWPPGERLLDTSWDGYWQLLTEEQKLTLIATKPRPKNTTPEQYMATLKLRTNANGVAKTHQLHIGFMGPTYTRYRRNLLSGYAALAREVAYPTLACADPIWMSQTRALDWMPQSPRDYKTFRDEENYFDGLLQLMNESVASNKWYGFWDWGGFHQHVYPVTPMPRNKTFDQDAGQPTWHRAHPKSHYLWGGFPWLQYLRSGDRKWLQYGQTFTLYSSDRAHVHHTGNGRTNGAEFHYDNSEVHWLGGYQRTPGGDQVASNLQSKDDYVYMYWLTGDRHALDVLEASADLICNTKNYSQPKPGFSSGNEIRNTGMLIHRMTMAYQATWNPRYLQKAKELAAAFYPLTDVEKVANAEKSPEWHFHNALGWAYEGMWFYWNITHDPQFRQPFMAFINRGRDYGAGVSADYGTARAMAYGYMLTSDEEYLNLGRGILDDQVSKAVRPESFGPNEKMNFSAMPRLMGAMTTAPDAWRAAYLPTHENGRVLTYRALSKPNNPAYAAHRAFIRKTSDEAWSFSLVATYGGRFVLYAPNGKIAAEQTLDETTARYARFEIPADGQTGDYMLVCPEPGKGYLANLRSGLDPMARIVSCKWQVTLEAFKDDQVDEVNARAFYFTSDADAKLTPQLNLIYMDHRRPFVISAANATGDDAWKYDSRDHVPGMQGNRTIEFPADQPSTIYGLEFLVPPYWVDNQHSRPQIIQLKNAPNFIAANAKDVFIPTIPNVTP